MKKLPNIIYMHTHDTGRYIQPYGYAVDTPVMQQFAEEGVLFRQAFCAAPTCSPSRAALVTGQMPHQCGMLGLSHMGFQLNDYKCHIVHTLQQAGYLCALSGIQHEDGPSDDYRQIYASRIGYDLLLDVADMQNRWDHEMAHIRAAEFLISSPKKPFFLAVGFGETHRAFPEPVNERGIKYCRPPSPIADTPQTRQEMAAYMCSAHIVDDKMGYVLTALRESGLEDNTLVIITTDHGLPFPAMKTNLTDHGIGVMLMMRGPGGFTGGRVIDAQVSHLDIFPTVCELTGITPPTWLTGSSLTPLLQDSTTEIHPQLFSEVNYHGSYEPMRAIRTPRWKYIRRYDHREKPVIMNSDESVTRDMWQEYGWNKRLFADEQLYDLFFDPHEACNLAGDIAYQPILDDMRARLLLAMEDTADPLLQGPVELPKGAAVFPRDAQSFEEAVYLGPLNPLVDL